jgi:F-type H+-transporting ATPase subunit b
MSLILAAEGGKFNPLAPEPGLFVWTTIAFIAVLYLLSKKVFPKLQETLADREQKIKADFEKAEKTRAEAERVLEDYKAKVAQAREEANRMIEEARQSAESVRKELIAKAEEDARQTVDKARNQLDAERDRALSELHSQLAEWSTAIAAQIVDKQLDPQSHKDLVEQFIKQIEQEAAER